MKRGSTKAKRKLLAVAVEPVVRRMQIMTVRELYGTITEAKKDAIYWMLPERLGEKSIASVWKKNPVVEWPAKWVNRVRRQRGILSSNPAGQTRRDDVAKLEE